MINIGKTIDQLLDELDACPRGMPGWQDFEVLATDILESLFVPPLHPPLIQTRTVLGTYRRDAIFPNRQVAGGGPWHLLFHDAGARAILVEYKNFDREEIGVEELDQVLIYMRDEMGKLALMVCNKDPSNAALVHQRTIYTNVRKIILMLTPTHLREMVERKQRGEEPADLILDLQEELILRRD